MYEDTFDRLEEMLNHLATLLANPETRAELKSRASFDTTFLIHLIDKWHEPGFGTRNDIKPEDRDSARRRPDADGWVTPHRDPPPAGPGVPAAEQ